MNIAPYSGDYFNSLMIVPLALTVLHKAKTTGRGESIGLAMYETPLRAGTYYMMDYLNADITYPRPGARHQNLCAIGEHAYRDGYIGLCVYGAAQNKYFLKTIGLGDLWGTPEYPEDTSTLWLDGPKADLTQCKLEKYLAGQLKIDVQKDFVGHRIAAQAVNGFEDTVVEDHMARRECFIRWENVEGAPVKGLNTLPRFVNNLGGFWRPMPPLGYDTRDMLIQAGLTPGDLAQFEESGAIRFED